MSYLEIMGEELHSFVAEQCRKYSLYKMSNLNYAECHDPLHPFRPCYVLVLSQPTVKPEQRTLNAIAHYISSCKSPSIYAHAEPIPPDDSNPYHRVQFTLVPFDYVPTEAEQLSCSPLSSCLTVCGMSNLERLGNELHTFVELRCRKYGIYMMTHIDHVYADHPYIVNMNPKYYVSISTSSDTIDQRIYDKMDAFIQSATATTHMRL